VRGNPHDRVLDNIDFWSTERRAAETKFVNLLRYRRDIRFDAFDPSQRYYFYPLHLEPEAVVLYHAHGLYTNQVKLIQNIAAQLPPGVLLYVKDHPHDHGYRSADDYLALKAVPNIRLLDSSVSGKEVIAHSMGVITQTGTAGFEALLLGKQVYTFGKTFYSPAPGVVYLRNIRDLRAALYTADERPPVSDAALHRYLTAYFAALHPGLTDYFAGRAQRYGIDLEQNAKEVAAGLLATLQAAE
jgi:capsule polysaccharide modification protein KpsS